MNDFCQREGNIKSLEIFVKRKPLNECDSIIRMRLKGRFFDGKKEG